MSMARHYLPIPAAFETSLNPNTSSGQSPNSRFVFPVGQKRRSPHRLLLSGCLCAIVLLSLAAPALSADVTLAWDPNTEVDLEGYGVYFKQGASGPPYDLVGYVTLEELQDPDNPAFAITDLEKGSNYYFAVTAYDAARETRALILLPFVPRSVIRSCHAPVQTAVGVQATVAGQAEAALQAGAVVEVKRGRMFY